MKLRVTNFGRTLKVSAKCKEISMNKYYQRRIQEIIFQEGIEKIGKSAFSHTNIKNLKLPNSLKELGYRAFESSKIETLKLGENLKVIERATFLCNQIKNLKLSKNIEVIEDAAFRCNNIEKLEFNDKIKTIGVNAFSQNQIKELTIPESVEDMEIEAFSNNNIEKLNLNSNLKIIKSGLFKSNSLTNIDLKNVQRIENEAFFKNKIKKLELRENVSYIGNYAFANNDIKDLKLNNRLNQINPYTFFKNKIEKLEIPNNIKVIGKLAFLENNISELKLNEGLLKIGNRAFKDNNLTSIYIPSSVREIGYEAFDLIDIYYRGHKFDKKLLENFGTEYIIKMADCKDAFNGINFDLFYPVELELIPSDVDSLKGFSSTNKQYRIFEKEMNKNLNNRLNKHDFYEDFFKLCYILGVFRQEQNSKEAVIRLYDCLGASGIHNLMMNITLTKYDKKYANTIINATLENKIDEVEFVIPHFYNNLDIVKKGILKVKENKIMTLNKLIKRDGKIELTEEYEKLKKEKNQISIYDVCEFVKNNLFGISEENKELRAYAPILNGNIEMYQIKDIEDILNKAKLQKDSKFHTISGINKEYNYKWLDNKDPLNLVLGYLVNCCAKLKGAGEDIMIQSMTNPNLRNLVIFKNNEVIAKTTAFYNNDYILCNNIEVSDRYSKNKNISYENKIELLKTIKQGLLEQANEMEKQGNKVNEIRIGMCRNDLGYFIEKEQYKIEKDNLFENYRFNRYQGDANNKAFGQAIIYKK